MFNAKKILGLFTNTYLMVSGRMVSPSTPQGLCGVHLEPQLGHNAIVHRDDAAPIITSASCREHTPAWAMYRLAAWLPWNPARSELQFGAFEGWLSARTRLGVTCATSFG